MYFWSFIATLMSRPRRLFRSPAAFTAIAVLLAPGCAVGDGETSRGSEIATAATADSTGPAPESTTSSTSTTTADTVTSDITVTGAATASGDTTAAATSEASTTGDVTTGGTSTTDVVMTTDTTTGTTGSAVVCGDARVAGDEECDDGNAINDDDCSNSCQSPRMVFVTSIAYKGDLAPQLADEQGLDLADAHCQQQAELGGLAGHFRAWISDGTGSPATRFDITFGGSYKLVTGDTVAAGGWPDLTDGTLAHAIDRDQDGTAFPADAVWTNTKPDGTVLSPDEGCSGWTSTSAGLKSFAGFSSSVDGTWTANEPNLCSVGDRLYCFQDVP